MTEAEYEAVHGRRPTYLRKLQVSFASIVDHGANPGAQILIAKRDAAEGVAKTMEHTTEQAAAWAEICELGDAVRKSNPKLTVEQARTEVMHTPQGVELLKRYRDPLSALPIAKAATKREQYQRFGRPGDILHNLAANRSKLNKSTYIDELHAAMAEFPDVARCYHAGDRW